MSVKIKLKRLGKIRAPYYRIVVADSRTKRDGRAIEEIGKYHPKAEPSFIEVDSERAQHWLSVGAQPTDPVRKILEVTGDWQKFKGLPGAEGTLKTAAPKEDRKEIFAAAVKETLGDAAPAPKGKSRSAKDSDAAAEKAAKPAAKDAPAKAERPARAKADQPAKADRRPRPRPMATAARRARRTRRRARRTRPPRPMPRPREPRKPRPTLPQWPQTRILRAGTDVLEEALEHLVRGIVEFPDDVRVDSRGLRRGRVLEVRVHPDDLGKVIGRGGRTARALRTVIGSLAGNAYVRVDLLDTDEIR